MSPAKKRVPRRSRDTLARDLRVDDDLAGVPRILEYLSSRSGTALCDACISAALGIVVGDVRIATARLAKTEYCEQGLWWCGRCSMKGSVTVAIPGRRR